MIPTSMLNGGIVSVSYHFCLCNDVNEENVTLDNSKEEVVDRKLGSNRFCFVSHRLEAAMFFFSSGQTKRRK